mmetsp:Transcript_13268/g.33846  ORF Transcript_13268/g.33846 Transcript_13268/m.33846 type:complete len:248 (-) Transcript_13268:143-886(-)
MQALLLHKRKLQVLASQFFIALFLHPPRTLRCHGLLLLDLLRALPLRLLHQLLVHLDSLLCAALLLLLLTCSFLLLFLELDEPHALLFVRSTLSGADFFLPPFQTQRGCFSLGAGLLLALHLLADGLATSLLFLASPLLSKLLFFAKGLLCEPSPLFFFVLELRLPLQVLEPLDFSLLTAPLLHLLLHPGALLLLSAELDLSFFLQFNLSHFEGEHLLHFLLLPELNFAEPGLFLLHQGGDGLLALV